MSGLYRRFLSWVCSWAGHSRDWPDMESCGRCACFMAPPDDFFDYSDDDDEPDKCQLCGGDGMDPGNDYMTTCPHCDGDGQL